MQTVAQQWVDIAVAIGGISAGLTLISVAMYLVWRG